MNVREAKIQVAFEAFDKYARKLRIRQELTLEDYTGLVTQVARCAAHGEYIVGTPVPATIKIRVGFTEGNTCVVCSTCAKAIKVFGLQDLMGFKTWIEARTFPQKSSKVVTVDDFQAYLGADKRAYAQVYCERLARADKVKRLEPFTYENTEGLPIHELVTIAKTLRPKMTIGQAKKLGLRVQAPDLVHGMRMTSDRQFVFDGPENELSFYGRRNISNDRADTFLH